MRDLAIYCAGGLGREIYCMIFKRIIPAIHKGSLKQIEGTLQTDVRFVGFFDDGVEKGKQLQYGPCLGGMTELNNWPSPIDIVIANGSPKWLKAISEKITNPKITFPNIIDPTVDFADQPTNKIGRGNIMTGSCWLSCNVVVGDFNLFNGNCVLGHEAIVGSYNALMPGVRVSGDVTIGNENLFGTNSFIIQGLKVGNNIQLSPGSILLTKPKNGYTYIGNPAKIFRY